MALEKPQLQAPPPAAPEFAKLYVRGLLDDAGLTGTEKTLIALVIHLSRCDRGKAWASHQYLADRLGLTRNHVQRVIRQLNAKFKAGETIWRILIQYRHGKSNLMRVPIPPDVLLAWRNPEPAAPATPAEARHASQPKPDAAAGTIFGRAEFRLFAVTEPGGDVVERLKRAVSDGEVTTVVVDGAERFITRVSSGHSVVWLHLAIEGKPTQTQPLSLPIHQLGAWRFFA